MRVMVISANQVTESSIKQGCPTGFNFSLCDIVTAETTLLLPNYRDVVLSILFESFVL